MKTLIMIVALTNGIPSDIPMVRETVGLFCEYEFEAIRQTNIILKLIDPSKSYSAVCVSTIQSE